jgi:hypothetical protein
MTTNCRANTPATCRTHGEVVRQDIALIHRHFDNVVSGFTRFTREEAGAAIASLPTRNTASETVAAKALDDLYRGYRDGVAIPTSTIADHLEDVIAEAKGKLHKGPIDFSDFPIAKLADDTLGGRHEARQWLRDHGISTEADDTVFGTKYIYCGAHVRPHESGWCTVGIDNKGPLQATEREAVYQEVRDLGLPIYGETAPYGTR